jgi:hypothetical protein
MRNQPLKSLSVFLCLLLSIGAANGQVISSMNFKQNAIQLGYASWNVIGLSMSFPEVIPYLNNTLFITRLNASVFNLDYNSLFYQSMHVPKGYKYNCSSTIYGANVSCTLDLALNSTLLNQMNKYFYYNTYFYTLDLGYDMEKSNFSASKYFSNFKAEMNLFSSDAINIELVDYGDQMGTIYNRTYNVFNFTSDVNIIYNGYGMSLTGPGITQNADTSWVSQIATLCNTYYMTFTFRCIIFPNSSQATISNILNESSSGDFLRKRLLDASGKTLDLAAYYVGINDIRLTNDSGINGVTNSFAAALWALDISLEFAAMSGYFMSFFNPLIASNHSIFGPGPDFNPTAIYYGLLFAVYALQGLPTIFKTTIVGGTSQNIKAYGIEIYYDYRVLIINKDTNPNITGVVEVTLDYPDGMRCLYLSAPDLSSTSNITFAGMYFVGNNSNYVGAFHYLDFYPSPSQMYSISLNYSQAVVCSQIPSPSYNNIPRGRSSSSF